MHLKSKNKKVKKLGNTAELQNRPLYLKIIKHTQIKSYETNED